MRSLVAIDGPEDEPLTVEAVRKHLGVDGDWFDDWIDDAITAAREAVEEYTGRRLMPQTLRMRLSDWPDCLDSQDPDYDADGVVRLPIEPVSAVVVKWIDEDGDEQTIDAGDLDLWLDHSPPLVSIKAGWPGLGDVQAPVSIDIDAGYTNADAVPARAKVAMKLAIANWFENRADQNVLIAKGLPPAAKFMLDQLWKG